MASIESRISRPSTKDIIRNTAYLIVFGGSVSAVMGGYSFLNEYKENNQKIGAIEQSLEQTSNRPSPQELQTTEDFIKSIEDELNAKSNNTKDLHEISSSLVGHATDFVEADQVLSRETAFQNKRQKAIEAFGANDLDDSNIWTLVAGSTAAVTGVGILGATLAKKDKPKPTPFASEE